jgi:hypothetical protein
MIRFVNSARWFTGAMILLPLLHPTPVVELAKQPDVIRQSLPEGAKFFLRKVTIGRVDLARIRQVVEYSPEDRDVKFYYGQGNEGKLAGVVLFPQVNTQHGPVEVGLVLGPSGEVLNAVVTKATVETKPWVQRAISAGLMKRFKGMKDPAEVDGALQGMSAQSMGSMPYYFAGVIAATVKRGIVLYRTLWR